MTVSVLQLAWMLREIRGLHDVWLLKSDKLEALQILFSYGLWNMQTYRRFKDNTFFLSLSYFVLPNTFYSVSIYLFFLFLFSHRKVLKELRNGHNKLVIEIRIVFCYGAHSVEESWRPPPPRPIKRVRYKFDVV